MSSFQDVLRNWNARFPAIVNTADQLVENAKNCIKAFEKGTVYRIRLFLYETNVRFKFRIL